MSEQVKVIDRKDLVRDTRSKAVLSADLKKLQAHREKTRLFIGIKNQQNEIENLKKEMSEIKMMLEKILAAMDNK